MPWLCQLVRTGRPDLTMLRLSWTHVVLAGPSCPIWFAPLSSGHDGAGPKLADEQLTAAEIEWRRWAHWQLQRSVARLNRPFASNA